MNPQSDPALAALVANAISTGLIRYHDPLPYKPRRGRTPGAPVMTMEQKREAKRKSNAQQKAAARKRLGAEGYKARCRAYRQQTTANIIAKIGLEAWREIKRGYESKSRGKAKLATAKAGCKLEG